MVYQFIFGAMWAHGMNWCEGKRQMTSTVFCCSTVLFIWGSVLAVCSIKWAQVRFVGEWESVQPIWSENFPTKRCAWRSVMRLNTQLFKISSMMSLCLLSKRVWRMAGQEKPWKFWVIITIKEGKLLTGHRISTHICLAQWILYMLIICWMSWSCPVLRSVSLSLAAVVSVHLDVDGNSYLTAINSVQNFLPSFIRIFFPSLCPATDGIWRRLRHSLLRFVLLSRRPFESHGNRPTEKKKVKSEMTRQVTITVILSLAIPLWWLRMISGHCGWMRQPTQHHPDPKRNTHTHRKVEYDLYVIIEKDKLKILLLN